jgi:large subunit ribosomal protein L21
MFAVIKTGGKQYTVHENDVLWVEKLDAEPGASVVLDEVLMVSDGKKVIVGTPTITGATVKATVVEQMRDRKVIIFKKKRRHNYRRKKGHRQHLTVLKIEKIVAAATEK